MPESRIEMFRSWFKHECESAEEIIRWLDSVPEDSRRDPRYAQALLLAGHLFACRDNWLDRIQTGAAHQIDWWPEGQQLEALPTQLEKVKTEWGAYLEELEEGTLDVDFDYAFRDAGKRWNLLGQLMQLVGHRFYHRGQVALLVDQLGGATTDTDYFYWMVAQDRERWPEFVAKPV